MHHNILVISKFEDNLLVSDFPVFKTLDLNSEITVPIELLQIWNINLSYD